MTSLSPKRQCICSDALARAINTIKKLCLVLAALFVAVMIFVTPAQADEVHSLTNNQDSVDIGNGDTKLVVDAETNTVSIIIDGKIMAVIDKEGLRVDGPVRSHSGPFDHLVLDQSGGDQDVP